MDDAAATPVLAYDGGTTDEPQSVVTGYVVLKTVGVLFVSAAVGTLLQWIAYLTYSGVRQLLVEPSLVFRILFPCVLYAGVGVVLLVYARGLARRLFRMGGTPVPMAPAQTLVAIVAVGVGLYLAASSLAEIVQLTFTLVYEMRQNGASFLPARSGEPWIGAIARIALGVWLFLRPGWVVGQWRTRTHMP